MEIIISDEVVDIFPVMPERIRIFAEKVIKSSGISNFDINIIFINNDKMTELNEQYKKRIGTTDVLSFNLSDATSDTLEGEVYISLERALAQSSEYGVSGEEEIIRLVTHGLLHLSGRTHNSDEDFESMTVDTEMYVRNYFDKGEVI
ncbi:rRNA maturation RNase YbeY [Candidatus Latescibacterota bacterium]